MKEAVTIGPRDPRKRDDAFLAFLRTKPCCVCGTRRRIEAAHIRMASAKHGKRYTGKGEKPHDRWATPLCQKHHAEQHATAEPTFWARVGRDPFLIAIAYYAIGRGVETTAKPKSRIKIRQRHNAWPEGRKLQGRGFETTGRKHQWASRPMQSRTKNAQAIRAN